MRRRQCIFYLETLKWYILINKIETKSLELIVKATEEILGVSLSYSKIKINEHFSKSAKQQTF